MGENDISPFKCSLFLIITFYVVFFMQLVRFSIPFMLLSMGFFTVLYLIFIKFKRFDFKRENELKLRNWIRDRKYFMIFMFVFITVDIMITLYYVVIVATHIEVHPVTLFFFDFPSGSGYYIWPIFQYLTQLILPSVISYYVVYRKLIRPSDENDIVLLKHGEKAIWAFFMTFMFLAFVWNLHIFD